MKNYLIAPFVVILFSSCIRGQIDVEMLAKKTSVNLQNVRLINHQIILNGQYLNSVTSLQLKESSSVTPLTIESKNSSTLIANTLSNVSLAAGKIFELIISDANGASSYTIDFSLCNSVLNTKGFDCTVTAIDKDVLSYDSASDKWIPRSLTGQWSASGSDVYRSAGKVGIGTSTPREALEVSGNIVFSEGANRTISTPDTEANSTSDIFFRTGNVTANPTSYKSAGSFLFYAGNNPYWGSGGSIMMYAGSSSLAPGGGVLIAGGGVVSNVHPAGGVSLHGGMNTSFSGKGGEVSLNGGWGGGTGGGNVTLVGGNSTNGGGNGGSIIINGGPPNTTGSNGNILLGNLRGNVGVGVANPSTKLQVAGVITPDADGTRNLGSASLKFKDIYATNNIIQTSDARLKTQIKDSDLGLDFINKLRPVSYKWKNNTDQSIHYGLIAQETNKSVKNAIVTYDAQTDLYGIRYSELIPPLIKAVQTLTKENEILKARLDKLESLVQKLK